LDENSDPKSILLRYPVIQILYCERENFEINDVMSIVLAHEVAHTLGLGEVYGNINGNSQDIDVSHSYDYDPDADNNFECVMKIFEGNASGFSNRINSSSDAFCDGCIDKIHNHIDGKDLYQSEEYDTTGYVEVVE
jgi:hypothetical protein